jgi:flagellar protein FlbT
MALVIDLKPNEKLLVGSTMITNDNQRTRLHIDGDAPVLREKDTMTVQDAVTPSKKLYFAIQSMYLVPADKALDFLDDYFDHYATIKDFAPHISHFLNDISIEVMHGTYYKALKLVQDLINFEKDGQEPASNIKEAEKELNSNMMEAKMLMQSAQQLQDVYDQWDEMTDTDKETTISYNRKLWMVFFDGSSSQMQGQSEKFAITTNITNIYNFIAGRSKQVLADNNKDGLLTLINLNAEAALAMQRTA